MTNPTLKIFPLFIKKERVNFWVALHENVVVGTIGLINIGNGEGALRKMFVHKKLPRQSIWNCIPIIETLFQWIEK